jgi:hypothetical protein
MEQGNTNPNYAHVLPADAIAAEHRKVADAEKSVLDAREARRRAEARMIADKAVRDAQTGQNR